MTWLAIGRSVAFRQHSFNAYVATVVTFQVTILACSVVLYAFQVDNWLLWLAPYAAPAVVLMLWDLAKGRSWALFSAWSGITRASLMLMPGAFAMAVLLRSDRFILPILSTDSQLGLYVAIATATEALSWVSLSLADHRVARFGGHSNGFKGFIRMLFRDALVFLGLAAGVALLILLALVPLLGPEFAAGSALVVPLCVAAVLLALLRQTNSWLLASSHPNMTTLLALVGGSISVPIYIVGIALAGAEGAAWASLISYAVALVTGITLIAVITQRKERHADEV